MDSKKITGHKIFDMKLGEGFRRKDRFVCDNPKTKTLTSVIYSSVLSRDSVRIILMIGTLNDLKIECADIENICLTVLCRERA